MKILNENFVENLDRENICKLIWWNDRCLKIKQKQKQQNDIDFANVCCFKLFEFELFEFLLIGAFWLTADIRNMTCWRQTNEQTKICEKDELNWLRDRFTLIVVFHFFMSFVFVSLLWCNRFIFIENIDCENVKNRTKQDMRFSCHWSKFISHCSELIECHWSEQIAETRRNETKFKFFVWNFEWLFVDCVWFLFFFLTSDVSTFQENEYCKDRSEINELIDSKKHEDRLLTECRLISTNKEIDYWLSL